MKNFKAIVQDLNRGTKLYFSLFIPLAWKAEGGYCYQSDVWRLRRCRRHRRRRRHKPCERDISSSVRRMMMILGGCERDHILKS